MAKPRYMSRARRFDAAQSQFESARDTAVQDFEDLIEEVNDLEKVTEEKIEDITERVDSIIASYDDEKGMAYSDIEVLKDEINTWKENIEERMSQTTLYSRLEDCESELETACDDIDCATVSFDTSSKTKDDVLAALEDAKDELNGYEMNASPEFPGMYGN